MKIETFFNWMTLLLFGAVLLLSGCAAPDYEEHIRHFASNTPPDTVRAAVQVIEKAGTNAFPTLLAHLEDKSPAEATAFQEQALGPNGEIGRPTIGSACFGMLQGQIEGNWPKGFQHYYVLSPQTIRDWLARHADLSLQQLRLAAAQESLGRAEADAPKDGESEFHQQTLEFLRKNLEEARRKTQ